MISENEGRSWRTLRKDIAGLLAWSDKTMYLLDTNGKLAASGDAGATWKPAGDVPGQPVAFIATETELYAALSDGTVMVSADGGDSWRIRTT